MPKLSFKKWTGDPPARPGIGKEREPNPFDEIVAKSYDDKESFSFDVPHDPNAEGYTDRSAEIGGYIKQLRNAARYLGHGLDVRIIGDQTIWFAARDPKPRKAKLPNDTPAT